MDKMVNFKRLAETFLYCANDNESIGSEYCRGKARAFEFAAKWLMEEVDNYEKENA